MAGHIKLQSSVGDFGEAFLQRLPALERAMIDHGIDPAAFVIARNLAQSPHLPVAYQPDGNMLEYTVFVKGRSFTVTQPNDQAFLKYFYDLCVAQEHKDAPHSLAQAVHSGERKLEALIGRLEKWLNEPI